MPSKDDRKTKKTTLDFLTGSGGDELEPIIDPVERYDPELPMLAPESAADVVDDLLSDDRGGNGNGNGATARDEGLEAGGPVEPAFAEPPLSGVASSRGAAADDLEAIVRSQRTSKLRLGDILKEMGLVTEEQVESAIGRQKETRKRLGQLLLEDGVV